MTTAGNASAALLDSRDARFAELDRLIADGRDDMVSAAVVPERMCRADIRSKRSEIRRAEYLRRCGRLPELEAHLAECLRSAEEKNDGELGRWALNARASLRGDR